MPNGQTCKIHPVAYTILLLKYQAAIPDGSSYCGQIKDKAEEIVPHCFSSELSPDLRVGFSQAEYYDMIAKNVKELIAIQFLQGEPDEQVWWTWSILFDSPLATGAPDKQWA